MVVNIRCVAVGDGAVGKTCMLISYTKDEFPRDHVPTIFENYTCDVPMDGDLIKLNLWDTAGQEDYDTIRSLSYKDVQVFLLCFSLTSKVSLDNIKTKWIKETKSHSPNAIYMLVGTKLDLREDEDFVERMKTNTNDKIVTTEDGLKYMNELKCHDYKECSALTTDGLKEVFESAMKAVLEQNENEDMRYKIVLKIEETKSVVLLYKLYIKNENLFIL